MIYKKAKNINKSSLYNNIFTSPSKKYKYFKSRKIFLKG